MSECCQGLTLTQNMSWGFLLVPHLLYKGLSISPIMYRCLLRVLCPVRRLVTTQDCVLLKDSSLVLAVGLGPEISLRACLWVLVTPCHIVICCLSVQRFIFLLVICLRNLKAGSDPTNWWTVSPLAISFPHIPECLGTQKSPTEWWVEMLFNAFGTDAPIATSSWQHEELSKLLDYQEKH